jgi:hypothetical protein
MLFFTQLEHEVSFSQVKQLALHGAQVFIPLFI